MHVFQLAFVNGESACCCASARKALTISSAAWCTASATLTVCDDPPATPAHGRLLSPYSKRTFSSGRPRRSAACCVCTVAVPIPISWQDV